MIDLCPKDSKVILYFVFLFMYLFLHVVDVLLFVHYQEQHVLRKYVHVVCHQVSQLLHMAASHRNPRARNVGAVVVWIGKLGEASIVVWWWLVVVG